MITTDTILQDIADTEREIAALEAARPAAEVLADRLLRIRIDSGIAERRAFVLRLRGMLEDV